jgi:hypothetical protein
MTALVIATNKTGREMALGRTRFFPIVSATAVPNRNGPKNSAAAAIQSAVETLSERDEIAAAMMPLESFRPFRKA